ncbi:MAG: hypothetical protein WBL58_01870 [Peptococcia bacterium]
MNHQRASRWLTVDHPGGNGAAKGCQRLWHPVTDCRPGQLDGQPSKQLNGQA